ncbi:glycoside hydrolase family 3 N-terminal domain-containing protein [Shewanella sp. UCD-KL12]|uniref:glycoside hydrolase family 3 N-terminal domain-containing protein n=1 Tax=Shewanella sp. UCD-KL12 TaxID=1917163 RepID=UPI000970C7E2|nr:glycoside hydrolase family 3 N-terminal domain-containing protein [Shewanella sp. UCD-KL12]
MSKLNKIVISLAVTGVLLVSLSSCGYKSAPDTELPTSSVSVALGELQSASKNSIEIWPKLSMELPANLADEERIAELLSGMTLEQKVAQMIQPEIRDITVDDMRQYGFGSYLNGGGAFPDNNKHATPADWIKLAESMYQASVDDSLDGSSIPTMWGTDAVHGHNNVIGATLFPHNIGLGAANNPVLIEQVAAITATEVMVTGIDWVFAPTVAVVRDDRWGRTYEGYSEDPQIVKEYAGAIVKGLQGTVGKDFLGDNRVISTVKHFLGDGGTQAGVDQGDNLSTEQQLFDIHAQGYVSGLTVGAQTVMASFNSWNGVKNHGNHYLLTQVLKERMGFDGLVVGDWNGHGQVTGCSNTSCAKAANAGLDIFMVPTAAWKPLYENTLAQVRSGEIALSRIDDAVTRILRVKLRAGLFDKPSPAKRVLSGKTELIGAKAHREIAKQAVRESLVLLKNENNLLPLNPNLQVLVAGDGADNIGKQSGGWSITWQGTNNSNADFPGGSSIYDGIKQTVVAAGGQVELNVAGEFSQKPDVAIVVFGEEPYAEGVGDVENLEFQANTKHDLALLKQFKAQGIPVVSVFLTGRPLWVNAELNASDAFVVAWLPGSEGDGVADVIFSKPDGSVNYAITGKLSYSWPANARQTKVNRFDDKYEPLFAYGYGLSYGQSDSLGSALSEKVERSREQVTSLSIFDGSVKSPWQLMIGSNGKREPVLSSIQSNGVVAYRTSDREVQEDARLVSFNGTGLGELSFVSPSSVDMKKLQGSDSALSLTLKLSHPISSPVQLSMECGDNCVGNIQLAPALTNLDVGQWQSLTVDLRCFSQAGMKFENSTSPFSISSRGKVTLEFSNISIEALSGKGADISCH